jgi:hypothetical protein
MCVFSLSSSFFLLILKAGLSDKTGAPVRQKTSTLANNATPSYSLLLTSGSAKLHCSQKHGKACKDPSLLKNRENAMLKDCETWGYRKIGH